MLSVKEAIEMRRSIRRFRPDDVPDELIEQRALPKPFARDVKVDIEGASVVAYVKLVLHRMLENTI